MHQLMYVVLKSWLLQMEDKEKADQTSDSVIADLNTQLEMLQVCAEVQAPSECLGRQT